MASILAPQLLLQKAVKWSGGLRRMGHCQVKQSLDGAHAYWRVSWRFVLLQISPSSYLNSHSSQLNGRLLLWASLFLANELLWVQQNSHSSQLHGWSPLWEGVDLNLRPSKSRSRSRSTTFTTMSLVGKRNNLQKTFFRFLIFVKVWHGRTIVTPRQTDRQTDRHAHTHTRKPIGIGQILQICQTIQIYSCSAINMSVIINNSR